MSASDGDVVRLIVHTPPGSGPDVMAKALVEGIAEVGVDGRRWEIEHLSGGHGEEAMQALRDGKGRMDILSTCTPSFLQTPLLQGLPYSFRDLTPIARLVSDRYLLVARANGPARSAADFRAYVGAGPTRSGGYMTGSINHLVALAVGDAWSAPVEFVITKSATDLAPALREDRIDWGIGTPGEVIGGLEDGSLAALAVLAPESLPRFPETPPISTLGLDIDITLWRGVMGPPTLTPEEQSRWDAILRAATRSEAWQAYLQKAALADGFLEGAAFGELLEREDAWYRQQLGRAGLLPERAHA